MMGMKLELVVRVRHPVNQSPYSILRRPSSYPPLKERGGRDALPVLSTALAVYLMKLPSTYPRLSLVPPEPFPFTHHR